MGLLQATFALFGEAVLFAGYSENMISLGIGIMLTLVGVGQFVTQAVLLPKALKRYDDALLVVFGLVLRTVGLFVFAALATPLLGGVASVMFAAGIGFMMPPLQSLTTTTVADELRGGVLGVYQSTISLSTIFSSAIAGTIFALNPTSPYWLGAGLSLVVMAPALVLVRRTGAGRRKPASLTISAD